MAIVDTNASPNGIDYLIPGNDDAIRAIELYCDLAARAAIDGMAEQLGQQGIDVGALEEAPVEEALAEEASSEGAAAGEAEAPVADEAEAAKPAEG